MCLISLAWGANPQFPLVIAANRDEFYDRPTQPLSAWQSASGQTIVGGRDLQSGGTWMGFTPGGRFACVTNVRNVRNVRNLRNVRPPSDAPLSMQPRSRGELAVAWLCSTLDVASWAKRVDAQAYAGFNLIVADWHARSCLYISNTQEIPPESVSDKAQEAINSIANENPLEDLLENSHTNARTIHWRSVVALSNASLNTPWPKAQRLKAALSDSLQNQPVLASLQENLLTALAHSQPAGAHDLPQTGLSPEQEMALSSAFVRYPASAPDALQAPHYGTRSSLVAVLDASGSLHLLEATHPTHTNSHHTTSYSLAW